MVLCLPLEDLSSGRASLGFHCLPGENFSVVLKGPSEDLSILPPTPRRTSLWSCCLFLEDLCRGRTSLWFPLSFWRTVSVALTSPRRTSL